MHVVGTGGHVDHGKSSLVRALTGTDPDRFIEEKLRGMTLDLGFAHLRYPDGVEAGIVDVPGHERFLHNMLAGAAGMELLLLVVAANEGPRPQTLEHLAILDYLNVRRALVVVTKRDLVDDEELAFVEESLREVVAGTVAQDAPILAVSTLTGEGMDALRAAIHDELLALPPRAPDAPPYLPVDRVFAVAGHGTVVTGTLMQGRLRVGEHVMLQPAGRELRIRGLQVFGERRDVVEGGARVAVNLPGIEVADIVRGDVLASPELVARSSFAVAFEPARGVAAMLKRRTPVRAAIGSAEILGTLVFDGTPGTEATSATLHLRRPTVTIPGEAFVVRRLSPKDLLGGGTIGDAREAGDDESDVTEANEAQPVLRALAASGLAALPASRLAELANLREERVLAILEPLVAGGIVRRLVRPVAFIDGSAADAFFARVVELLEAREASLPFILGATSITIARMLEADETFVVRLLASYVEDGRLAYRAGYYATLGFTPKLSDEQRAFFDRVVPIRPDQPFLPASLDDVLAQMKSSKIAGISGAFDTLVGTGALVKVGDALYRGTQITQIRARLESALRRQGRMTMADFRNLVGTTRKYAVPLFEWFDAAGVTIRDGDYRMLRARPPAAGASVQISAAIQSP